MMAMIDIDEQESTVSPCIGSFDEKYIYDSVPLSQQAGAAENNRIFEKPDTLRRKLSKMYGQDFGLRPFDLACVDNDDSSLISPQTRKAVEKNYQLLLVIRQFESNLQDIYGPVGSRVMTQERRGAMLQEGLTVELITRTHSDAVELYRAEKAAKVEQMEAIGDALRRETALAKSMSMEKHTRSKVPSEESVNRDKMVSVDLSDADVVGGEKSVELMSTLAEEELEFVSDYNTSVQDAKRAFAKQWVVMQAAEYELRGVTEDCKSAAEDMEELESRETFVRLTLAEEDNVSLGIGDSIGVEEAEARLNLLAEELKKVAAAEKFYRELRKRPKEEFTDVLLINDIVCNIDILIKEMTQQKKEVEKLIRHNKGLRVKAKILNRPIPRLLMGAVRRKSETGGNGAASGSVTASGSSSRPDCHSTSAS